MSAHELPVAFSPADKEEVALPPVKQAPGGRSEHDVIVSDLFPGRVTLSKPHTLGLFYDKAAESFTHRLVFFRAVSYPFFGIYLNMPGHLFGAINSIFPCVWCLKLLWGFLSDSTPILGKHRIYYMAIGWAISTVAYLVVILLPYPEPYYGLTDCRQNLSLVINPEAPQEGIKYIVVLAFAVLGVSIVDLASDALVVDYTKREPISVRGSVNAYAHISANMGTVLLFIILAGLDSPAYGGSFCWLPFTFQHVLMVFGVVSLFGLVNALFFTVDPNDMPAMTVWQQMGDFWKVMELRVFQRTAILFIFIPALMTAKSSGQVKVRKNWAKVTPLMSAVTEIVTAFLVALGMYLLKRFFLHKDWVKMFIIVKVYVLVVALIVETVTVFDIIRNQYFYFSEQFLSAIAIGMTVYLLLQLAAEISEEGNEALTFGMMMSNWTISSSVSIALGNLVSAGFDVTEDTRFLRDSPEDRWMVYGSIITAFGLNLLSIPLMLVLCPRQRTQVHELKVSLGRWRAGAVGYVVMLGVLLALTLALNVCVMLPATRCLVIVGGSGCTS